MSLCVKSHMASGEEFSVRVCERSPMASGEESLCVREHGVLVVDAEVLLDD